MHFCLLADFVDLCIISVLCPDRFNLLCDGQEPLTMTAKLQVEVDLFICNTGCLSNNLSSKMAYLLDRHCLNNSVTLRSRHQDLFH